MISVLLVAEAVAMGICPDPEVFGEMLAAEWIALRRMARR